MKANSRSLCRSWVRLQHLFAFGEGGVESLSLPSTLLQWKWKSLSCVWLLDPMDWNSHGILQVRILESVAFPFSRGSSQPRDQTQVSCTAGRFFNSWATREVLHLAKQNAKPPRTNTGAQDDPFILIVLEGKAELPSLSDSFLSPQSIHPITGTLNTASQDRSLDLVSNLNLIGWVLLGKSLNP